MEKKFESYYKILEGSRHLMDDATNEDYQEYYRAYLFAFINCIKLLSLYGSNSLDICSLELRKNEENAEQAERLVLVFTGKEEFLCESSVLNDIIKDDVQAALALEKVSSVVETATEPEPEPEPTLESEKNVGVHEPIEEAEPIVEEVIPEPEPAPIVTGDVQEVETIDVNSPIDYSAIIDKVTPEEKQKEKAPAVETVADTATEDETNNVSSFYFCDKFPKDSALNKKSLDSFMYDQYLIDAGEIKMKVNVYPLRYAAMEPVSTDVFVTIKGSNGTFRGYMSNKTGTKNIRAGFAGFEFVISGKWINNTFKSTVQLLKQAEIKITKKEHRPVNPTATTHLVTEINGKTLHIFPTEWKNNPNMGLIGPIIYSEEEGVIFLPNPQYYTPFEKDNVSDSIMAYWQGSGEQSELEISVVQ